MTRQLVLIHGRSQQGKDPIALKAEWLDALSEGLDKSGLKLPIPEESVRFPYYADKLADMINGESVESASEVITYGNRTDANDKNFMISILNQVLLKQDVGTVSNIVEGTSRETVNRGIQNWEWAQATLKGIDKYIPYASAASIALFTHDAYTYLSNPAVRMTIDEGVRAAITPGVQSIVVGHSLGSVIAYNLLRDKGIQQGWSVPLFVTVGSPLAISEITRSLKMFGPTRCPECVSHWYNALDERDVVALYRLDPAHFPLDPVKPAIENNWNVRNRTPNRHGIGGYLDDRDVARKIYDALIAP